MFKTRCIRHKYSTIFLLFLICYYGYTISRAYGFTFFPDEFGYWSYAAKAAGYDWSDIASLGSYYSYGYSLILIPIFILFHNAVTAYRMAVTLNFIFMGATFFLLVRIQQNFYPQADKERTELFAAIAVLYPAWLFYARSTMVEIALVFCFTLSCYLLQEYTKKKSIWVLIGYVVTLAYAYFLHMRAVGTLLAGILALVAVHLHKREKVKLKKQWVHAILLVFLLLVLLGIGYFVKKNMGYAMYAQNGTEDMNINDYAGQFDKIRYIFTKDGILDCIYGFAGKLLYVGIATFGLAYIGVWRSGKKIVEKAKHTPCYLFLILSLLAEISINTIFNVRPLRVDNVVYGRYHEYVLPVLIILGLWEMTADHKIMKKVGAIILLQLPMTWMAVKLIEKYQLTNIHGYVMIGMSYLHYVGEYNPTRLIWLTYLFAIPVTLLIAAIIKITQKHKEWQFLIIMIWVIEIALAMRASTLYLDASAKGAFRDTYIVDKIEELRTDNADGRLLYIDEEDNTIISILQFMLREEDIIVLPRKDNLESYSEEEMKPQDMVLIDFRSQFGTELSKMYENSTMNGHFILYYNK